MLLAHTTVRKSQKLGNRTDLSRRLHFRNLAANESGTSMIKIRLLYFQPISTLKSIRIAIQDSKRYRMYDAQQA